MLAGSVGHGQGDMAGPAAEARCCIRLAGQKWSCAGLTGTGRVGVGDVVGPAVEIGSCAGLTGGGAGWGEPKLYCTLLAVEVISVGGSC